MASQFPLTRPSAVRDLLSGDPARRARSLRVIAEAYWQPINGYLRRRWSLPADQADDLVQGFFAVALDRDALAQYQAERARFRTFLRTLVDRHVIDQHRRAQAARAGGGATAVELRDDLDAGIDPDALFAAAWLRHLMEVAISRLDEALVRKGKPIHAALFRAQHLDDPPPSYAEAAAAHGISVGDVTNWLHVARREFRRIALELLRELTPTDAEFADEARAVFGIEAHR